MSMKNAGFSLKTAKVCYTSGSKTNDGATCYQHARRLTYYHEGAIFMASAAIYHTPYPANYTRARGPQTLGVLR